MNNNIIIPILSLISEYTMMDAGKVSDDEKLQDLQMLPQGDPFLYFI